MATPNMSLPEPVVGVTSGPEWATLLIACLDIIDSHSHVAGSGVPITPAAININTDLSAAGFSLTNAKSVKFTAQGSPPASGSIYESGVDLYYVDGNGSNVRITQSGALAGAAGTITGLPSGTASASYVAISGNFVFQSATNTAANADFGSAILRNTSPNSTYSLTLSPPAALGANYALTLPSLPAGTSFLTVTSAGVISASVLTANGITRSNLAAVGQQISSSSGSYTTTSTTMTAVTNLTATITTTGRPVQVMLIAAEGTSNNSIGFQSNSAQSGQANIQIMRAGVAVARFGIGSSLVTGTTQVSSFSAAPSSVQHLDTPGAGTYTYTVETCAQFGTETVKFNGVKLAVYEL